VIGNAIRKAAFAPSWLDALLPSGEPLFHRLVARPSPLRPVVALFERSAAQNAFLRHA
jgi:hypothetical protein